VIELAFDIATLEIHNDDVREIPLFPRHCHHLMKCQTAEIESKVANRMAFAFFLASGHRTGSQLDIVRHIAYSVNGHSYLTEFTSCEHFVS
jgi:hypothetical protein